MPVLRPCPPCSQYEEHRLREAEYNYSQETAEKLVRHPLPIPVALNFA
jgi:hypothetical protein